MAREFHIGDILSASHGRLLSPRHMEGVYDVLGYMAGESLYTHQLPRIAREAEPVLRHSLPFLNEIEVPAFTSKEDIETWLADIAVKYGDTHPVPILSKDEHERIDPMSELAEMVHPDKIITVKISD